MREYLKNLEAVYKMGRLRPAGHSSAPARSLFGPQMTFNLQEGFPLLTTRPISLRVVFYELMWFLRGDSNVKYLHDHNIHIWDDWSLSKEFCEEGGWNENLVGSVGPLYPTMWRSWPNPDGSTVDQISQLINNLVNRPYSRRHVVNVWNPSVLPDESMSIEQNVVDDKQALAPCHPFFQFYIDPLYLHERMMLHYGRQIDPSEVLSLSPEQQVSMTEALNGQKVPIHSLSCKLTARSQDLPVGTPYNIASYSLFTMMLAHVFNFVPLGYHHSMGDVHIYENQMDLVKQQLERSPKPLPKLTFKRKVDSIFDFKWEDLHLEGYSPDKQISYPVTK